VSLLHKLGFKFGRWLKAGKEEVVTRARTIAMDRALSPEEAELVRWMIRHGLPEADQYAEQIESLRVVGGCSCGCPTIDFAVDTTRPNLPGSRVIAKALGRSLGVGDIGVLLFADHGQISMLEVYAYDDWDSPFPLPEIDTLSPDISSYD
jgi:hypothetical protein